MTQTRRDGRPRGFTLIELLIAMLVLAIGIMAVLSMQFTALGGAMISRDNSNAADIARRVSNVLRLESQQWRDGTISTSGMDSVFDTGTSKWKFSPALSEIDAQGGQWSTASWVTLFSQPVDSRLSDEGATRYCAYARGAYLGDDNEIFQVQIAVVFPGTNNDYPTDGCAATDITTQLDPTLAPEDSMQMDGYRVQYFGTQILRRSFLAPSGGVGTTGGA